MERRPAATPGAMTTICVSQGRLVPPLTHSRRCPGTTQGCNSPPIRRRGPGPPVLPVASPTSLTPHSAVGRRRGFRTTPAGRTQTNPSPRSAEGRRRGLKLHAAPVRRARTYARKGPAGLTRSGLRGQSQPAAQQGPQGRRCTSTRTRRGSTGTPNRTLRGAGRARVSRIARPGVEVGRAR